jgi:single-stranded-DNA-specific exonuclease
MNCNPWPWVVPHTDEDTAGRLAEHLGVHRLTAACLVQRGVSDEQEARFFLHGGPERLADPFLMDGMEKAVRRLAEAVHRKEKTFIYGDYDADGVTSVALLCRGLQELGVPVEYYIPSRLGDGYGLHGHVLEGIASRDGRLVLTVDCGINAFAEMDLARELGLDLIITDHHECFPGERSAYAVLNPKQPHCGYPEKSLAGVGVAWTLLRGLHRQLEIPYDKTAQWLDLVAVGSIADVVPLLGENRILVREGLRKLAECALPGLAALARAGGLEDTKLNANQVAFILSPRLNAPGRLGDAGPAVETLLAGPETADALAAELSEKNSLRQQVEKDILGQARELAATRAHDPALVLWHDDWHPGVVGIVAGRLAAEYARPVALIARDGEAAHGSVRSVPGCNVVQALQCCAAELERFGGHPEAAGLSVKSGMLEGFREAFCQAVAGQGAEEYSLSVVAEGEPTEFSLQLVDELAMLEPFGQGNPEPLFMLRDVSVTSARRVGARSTHLQLRLQKSSPVMAAIFFGGGEREIPRGAMVDVVVTPAANNWQGRTSLSLQIRDLRLSPGTAAAAVSDRRGGEKESFLDGLVREKKVVAWVNTRAAGDHLTARFGRRLFVSQLGRQIPSEPCDTLFFYHLPFDREALAALYRQMNFTGRPEICLAYGGADLLLNERIYAATIPSMKTMEQLAACLEQREELTVEAAKQALSMPVTAHLLNQARAVLEEAAPDGRESCRQAILANLESSATYRECHEALTAFRACQEFLWEAPAAEIARFLDDPGRMTLPKGDRHNESANTESAN